MSNVVPLKPLTPRQESDLVNRLTAMAERMATMATTPEQQRNAQARLERIYTLREQARVQADRIDGGAS